MESEEHEEIVELLKESIAASNRTTHAVRAIVLPSTIMLVALLFALPVALIAFVFDSDGAWFFAGVIVVVAAILAIVSQIDETSASNVPVSGDLSPLPRNQDTTTVSTDLSEMHDPGLASPATSTEGASMSPKPACRFCGKPFPPGYWDYCPDCGKN
jgi:hypothetical protein